MLGPDPFPRVGAQPRSAGPRLRADSPPACREGEVEGAPSRPGVAGGCVGRRIGAVGDIRAAASSPPAPTLGRGCSWSGPPRPRSRRRPRTSFPRTACGKGGAPLPPRTAHHVIPPLHPPCTPYRPLAAGGLAAHPGRRDRGRPGRDPIRAAGRPHPFSGPRGTRPRHHPRPDRSPHRCRRGGGRGPRLRHVRRHRARPRPPRSPPPPRTHPHRPPHPPSKPAPRRHRYPRPPHLLPSRLTAPAPAECLIVDVIQVTFADSSFLNALIRLRNNRPLTRTTGVTRRTAGNRTT